MGLQPIILLTGFEPFGGRTINTSWEAVRQLNGLVIGGARVESKELPVSWHGSAEMVIDFIHTEKPILVVNVGEGGPILSLEQYAHNRNHTICDNAGKLPDTTPILSNAPARFETPLDIIALSHVLTQKEVQHVVSSDAGGYICNFVSFHTYASIQTMQPHLPALFVHVPPASSSDDGANISQALIIILQQLMDQVAQYRT